MSVSILEGGRDMKVLIIVPAYNEEENILHVLEDIRTHLPQCDYLFVNDCSRDKTAEILDINGINHIDLPINLGLSGAVQAGYKYAVKHDYDAAIQFDSDGQHQAVYIKKMIETMHEGYDIVIGSRFVDKKKPISLRMIGSRMISFTIKMCTGTVINDPTSGMRMLNKQMIHDYAFNMNRKPEPDTLAFQLKRGAKIKEVQVEMNERQFGTSLYQGLGPSFRYMITMLVSIIFFS